METKLQIISGKYRGQKIAIPPSARPTSARARIGIFNMIGELIIAPVVVWDAFAGSGEFGIEFLSRIWCKCAIFTDKDNDAIKTIRKNIVRADDGLQKIIVEQTDAITAIPRFAPITDIVFVDPPYAAATLGETFVAQFATRARAGTIIVWETEHAKTKCEAPANAEIIKDKTYGRARFIIMKIK